MVSTSTIFPESLKRLAPVAALALLSLIVVPAQESAPPAGARGVIRLRARVKLGNSTKGLPRKRFFLFPGSLDQNRNLVETMERHPVVTRDCYYRNAGASEQLINWLRESDCESVYCREIEPNDLEGPTAVPEFRTAIASGEREFGNRQIARRWLAVNVPESLRDGFYKQRRNDIEAIVKQAEAHPGAKVISVMTDRNGTAYFTDLEPGTYTLSNIIPVEIEASTAMWNCEIQVKAGDLATEKPFLISNRKDKNVKCVAVEKPIPVCNVPTRQ
jgi:hypothetical protein